ncbi:MAG: hypothetical protein IPK83_00605 [Planctomycetes bacterium]|nr:hypothetical protein [Planctomycetota bacterium]
MPTIYVLWLTVTRWNGVPASMSHPIELVPRDAAFANVIAALPPLPPITLPPPPNGMRWTGSAKAIDPSETMYGKWDIEARPNLQCTIAFLKTPAVSNMLNALIALPHGEYEGRTIQASTVRTVARLLATRARYRAEEKDDLCGAFDDLIGLLRISQNVMRMESGILVLTGSSCESMALHELARLALERPLTREFAQAQIKQINATGGASPSLFELITEATTSEVIAALDNCYSIDMNGNGWLVLSHQTGVLSSVPTNSGVRLGAWNLLSPLFNDRRTVISKVEFIRREMLRAGEMSFSKGTTYIHDLERSNPLNHLDGPAWMNTPLSNGAYILTLSSGRTAIYAAAATVIATSAYQAETQRLPASIDHLVPEYLSAVPIDPFDGHSLRMQARAKSPGFILYSVGPNQRDDAGMPASEVISGTRQGDQIYDFMRTDALYFEPKLEKVSK